MHLILNPRRSHPHFQRTVERDDGPNVVYTFHRGELVDVDEPDLVGLADDLGVALFVPKEGTTKPDFEATKSLAEEVAAFRERERPPQRQKPKSSPSDAEFNRLVIANKTLHEECRTLRALNDSQAIQIGELSKVNLEQQAEIELLRERVAQLEPPADPTSQEGEPPPAP